MSSTSRMAAAAFWPTAEATRWRGAASRVGPVMRLGATAIRCHPGSPAAIRTQDCSEGGAVHLVPDKAALSGMTTAWGNGIVQDHTSNVTSAPAAGWFRSLTVLAARAHVGLPAARSRRSRRPPPVSFSPPNAPPISASRADIDVGDAAVAALARHEVSSASRTSSVKIDDDRPWATSFWRRWRRPAPGSASRRGSARRSPCCTMSAWASHLDQARGRRSRRPARRPRRGSPPITLPPAARAAVSARLHGVEGAPCRSAGRPAPRPRAGSPTGVAGIGALQAGRRRRHRRRRARTSGAGWCSAGPPCPWRRRPRRAAVEVQVGRGATIGGVVSAQLQQGAGEAGGQLRTHRAAHRPSSRWPRPAGPWGGRPAPRRPRGRSISRSTGRPGRRGRTRGRALEQGLRSPGPPAASFPRASTRRCRRRRRPGRRSTTRRRQGS